MAYPSSEVIFKLDTDASNFGIGGVISQIQDGHERVIAYGSRSLTKAERNYCVTRRELLAIVHFVKYFHHYLYGQKFIVRTDHAALRWLFNFKEPEGQIARWLQVLGTYDFDIIHRPGRQHGNADGLSRIPCKQCGNGVTDSENDSSLVIQAVNTRAKSVALQSEQSQDDLSTPTAAKMTNEGDNNSTVKWAETYSEDEVRKLQSEDTCLAEIITMKNAGQDKPQGGDRSQVILQRKGLILPSGNNLC